MQQQPNPYEDYKPKRVRIAVREFLADKAAQTSMRRNKNLKSHLDVLCIVVGDMILDSVTPAELQLAMSNKHWGAQTANVWLNDVSCFWNWCLSRHYATRNPAQHTPRRKVTRTAPAVMTPEQAEEILTVAPSYRRGCIAVQLFGGLRPVEAYAFHLGHIQEGEIVVQSSKTGRRRSFPMEGNLIEILENGEHSFPAPRCTKWFSKITKKLSFNYTQDMMRHSYVSYHYAYYKNKMDTAYNAGHSVETLDQYYRNAVTHDAAVQYFSINVR